MAVDGEEDVVDLHAVRVSTLTLFCGWASVVSSRGRSVTDALYSLAITGRLWANSPYTTTEEFHSRVIGVPSQVVAILWMGLSAAIDGCITCMLLYRFSRARHSIFLSTRTLVRRMITLTLSTVLLTHIVGGVMCIIFIASPSSHRTKSNILWVLLEMITELYALSAVFTINSREPPSPPPSLHENEEEEAKSTRGAEFPMTQTALDRQVEGYQGSTPFGVRVAFFSHQQGIRNGKETGEDWDLMMNGNGVPTSSAEGLGTSETPNPELAEYMFPHQSQHLHDLESNGRGGEERRANSVSEEVEQRRNQA
ncbi:hypothetical protein I315_04775 [Cryptococcus gattii Ru294]|nr:hypothetical protein I315_04775 [Cryptococcus gattii Ru294]